jgi:hypothetical protein
MPLSTNWFEGVDVTDNFISEKDGLDSQGGTQAAPKQTLDSGIVAGKKNIIRSGVYAPSVSTLTLNNSELTGDSENVFIYGVNGLTEINTTNTSPLGPFKIKNINFVNINRLFILGNSGLGTFDKCVIKNADIVDNNGTITTADAISTGNIYIDIGIFNIKFKGYHEKCNFINCTTINITPIDLNAENIHSNNYFQNCNIITGGAASAVLTFRNCVFDKTTTLDGTTMDTVLGVPESTSASNINKATINGYPLNGSRTANFSNCYWIDKANPTPVFNDEAGGDYSLSLSPNQSVLFNGGDIVGARPLALTLNANSQPFNTGAGNGSSLVNLTNVGGKFELNVGFNEGTATSAILNSANITGNQVIKLPQRILLTDAIRFFGNLLPQNALSGTGEVVDRLNYDAVTNQEVRYTIRLRYWDDDETPGNEVKPAGGGWYEIEHGNIFGVEVDGSGRGNGNVDVDTTDLSPIFADKFQVEFVLRDNGN